MLLGGEDAVLDERRERRDGTSRRELNALENDETLPSRNNSSSS